MRFTTRNLLVNQELKTIHKNANEYEVGMLLNLHSNMSVCPWQLTKHHEIEEQLPQS